MDASLYHLLQQGATLISASAHLAHVLQNEYAEQAQQQGLTVWPTPRILPWNTYIRQACAQQRDRQASPLRLLSDTQSLTLWEHIVAEFNQQLDDDRRLLNPSQAARAAQRSWQHLHRFCMPLKQVAAWPMEEAQVFAEWAQTFVQRTEQQGWLDTPRFTSWLLQTDFRPEAALLTYGYADITPDMGHTLQQWQQSGTEVHYWPLPAVQTEVSIVSARDADTELQLAAQWARAQVLKGRARVGVVVPSLARQAAQVQRRFTEAFAPEQRRIDVAPTPLAFRAVDTPALSSYPLVHDALLVLELLQGRADVLLIGQLLRSPFFAGYESEAAARALADIEARERRTEVWNVSTLERLASTRQCPQLAACMLVTGNDLREHHGLALPSVWTERFTQWLFLSGWARGRTLDSAELQVQNKFRQILTELSALDELLGRIDMATAVASTRDACHSAHFAPEAIDQPVTIVASDSALGLRFDAVWVMGLQANDWPPAPEPDPFIPTELQRSFGMPQASAELQLRAARQALQHLITSAAEVTLSWPEHQGDEELRRSPLLDELTAHRTEAGTLESLALDKQWFAARPALDSWQDEFAPPMPPGNVRGGSRVLELQSRCPFKAQAVLRLNASEMPGVSPAVEPMERGNLLHKVLAEVWQQLKDSDGLQRLDLAQYVHTVREIAQRQSQQVLKHFDTPHGRRLADLEAEQCTQWVMRLLELDLERAPFRVQRAEQTEHYELAGMRMRIQLDRIDELSNQGKLLIDYKTGNNKPADWLDRETPGRPRSPQLPLYALAHREQLEGIAFALLKPGPLEYKGLAKSDGIAVGINRYEALKASSKLSGVDDWDTLLDHWQLVLDKLARDYLAGAAQVDPLKNECNYCHLTALCRVHSLSGSNTDEEAEEGSHD